MSWEEKRNWIYLFIVAATYLGYVAIIVGRAEETPITEVAYAWPMIGSIVASIVAAIVGAIVAAITSPRDADKRDERDEHIHRHGEVVGVPVLCVGVLGALVLTMAEAEHFWIGNAIYLAMVVSALVTTIVKLIAYRRGF